MISDFLVGYGLKETMNNLNKLSNDDKILNVIKMNMDFSLLESERNKDGYLLYNGDMILDKKNITELPENLKVMGDLWVSFNPLLTEIPKGLYVDKKLYCYNCNIKKLPDNLYIGSDLDCSNNLIEKLPSGLNVKNNLTITDNLIEEIPSDIYVGGNLYCDKDYSIIIPKDANIIGELIGNWIQK